MPKIEGKIYKPRGFDPIKHDRRALAVSLCGRGGGGRVLAGTGVPVSQPIWRTMRYGTLLPLHLKVTVQGGCLSLFPLIDQNGTRNLKMNSVLQLLK
jgi:hypothetical protein